MGVLWKNGKKETLINFILIINLISFYFFLILLLKIKNKEEYQLKI